MDNKSCQKVAKMKIHKYSCLKCNYNTSNLNNFTKHKMTLKHQRITMDNKSCKKVAMVPNDDNRFNCECGKSYKYNSGLSKHKKVCDGINKTNSLTGDVSNLVPGNLDKDALIVELFKKMDEKDKQISELIPKVGNTTNNNNQFNLNVFLNEDCKDAINWTEFVESIELELNALECLKESNITIGITNAICNKMNELGVYKRPIHCLDPHRRKLCIKNDEDWEKNENKVDELIVKSDKRLQHKYISMICDFERNNPEWVNTEKGMEEYMELNKKIYESVDNEKCKSMLIKGSIIPKEIIPE